MPTDTTPASRALARIDAIVALDAPPAKFYVAAPAPLLALARAAVLRSAAWDRLVSTNDCDPSEPEWGAWGEADMAFDRAVDALVDALAGGQEV